MIIQGISRMSEKSNFIRDISATNQQNLALFEGTNPKLTLPSHSSDSSDFKTCNNFTESDGSRSVQNSCFSFHNDNTESYAMSSEETKPSKSEDPQIQKFKSVPLDEEILKIKLHIE